MSNNMSRVLQIFWFTVAFFMMLSGMYMVIAGNDYARGTFMLCAGGLFYLIMQVGIIVEYVNYRMKYKE